MQTNKPLLKTIVPLLMIIGGVILIFSLAIQQPGQSFAQDPAETEEPGDGGGVSDEDELVAQGQYLVQAVAACQSCHIGYGDYSAAYTDPLNASLAGGLEFAYEPWGTVVAPNLTVLGDWTDEEIENAIRYGVRPDGTTLLPPMSYAAYADMSDEDMTAIIAYLRSLEPEENEIAEATIYEGTREDVRTVPEIDPDAEFPAPNMDDQLEYGTYLASHVTACVRCHGSVTEEGQLDPTGPAIGQVTVHSEFGAFQLPSLAQSEMGEWTDEELQTLLHDGIKPDGEPVFFMPAFAFGNMTDADIDAIIAWIRSQP